MIRSDIIAGAVLFAFLGMPHADAQTLGSNPHGTLPAGLDCVACHQSGSWSPLARNPSFKHEVWQLLGSHEAVSCVNCHGSLEFSLLEGATVCADCHEDVHGGSFGAVCADCHTESGFNEVDGIGLHLKTRFPLEGSHLQLTCESCHDGSLDRILPEPDCITCHQPDYQAQHAGSGFPETCLTCHTQASWSGAVFDHQGATGYPLVGAHEPLSCDNCHTGPDLALLFAPAGPEDCITCHQPDYQAQHAGSGFPETCLTCHTQASWSGAVFDHQGATGYPLVGAHEPLSCDNCHTGPDLALLFAPAGPEDCITCHQPDYQAQHAGSGFPETCLTCHTQATWSGAVFDHQGTTGYPLVGAHEPLSCDNCHTGPDLALLFAPAGPEDCITCHQPDYQAQHAGSGFPETCLTCHTQASWSGAVFDHQGATGYPLVGAHEPLSCDNCHTGPDLALLFAPAGPEDCITCHQPDYQAQHAGSGFPETCLTCHTQANWAGSTFRAHDSQYFPIYSGTHRGEWTTCADCHTGAPSDFSTFSCLNCHEHSQQRMDNEHRNIGGYAYVSSLCLSCHPTGRD